MCNVYWKWILLEISSGLAQDIFIFLYLKIKMKKNFLLNENFFLVYNFAERSLIST